MTQNRFWSAVVVGLTVVSATVLLSQTAAPPRTEAFKSDEYLLLGSPNRGAGEPMGQAWVALFDDAEPAQEPASEVPPVAMTMTDFRGHFELDAPRERALRLHVSSLLGGYQDHDAPLEERGAALEIRLASVAQSEPLVGLVLDPLGAPLEGIPVAIQPPENRFCGCLSFETRSGKDGLVTFPPLADKDYRIVARDPEQRWAEVEVFPARPGGYFEVVFE